MIRRIGRIALLAGAFAALCACDHAADKQREEAAINRGDPAVSAPVVSFESECKRAGGAFRVDAATSTSECRVTAAACASLGEWRDGVGCVLAATAAADCVGMPGLKVVGDLCTIAQLDRDQIAQ